MPVTQATAVPPLKKFLSNNILSELYRIAGETGDSTKIVSLREAICEAIPTTPAMLGRWINNTSQPELPQAFAIAQVLGVSVDALCRPAE
jgi:hypothetical protein